MKLVFSFAAVAPAQFFLLTFCLLCAWSTSALADTNQIELSAWLEPNHDIAVSQQVNLFIEIATPHWFTGGTRIAAFEIDDVVVLRREKFAVNSTRRQGTDSWSVQTWTITLYPQRADSFRIPQIAVMVSAANDNGVAEQYAMRTEALSFSALIPSDVAQMLSETASASQPWLATHRFEVSERYDKATTNLQIGDAVKRVIEISAENVAAMMLPALAFPKIPGLAAYQAPPKIMDSINRGDYLASRLETLSYVIEQEGTYTLPAMSFVWWDLANQTLQTQTLAARTISTEAVITGESMPVSQVQQTQTESTELLSKKSIALALLGFLGLAGVVSLLFARSRQTQQPSMPKARRRLVKQYRQLCRQHDYPQASKVFYQWLSLQSRVSTTSNASDSLRQYLREQNALDLLKLFEDLMAAAHGFQQSLPKAAMEGRADIVELPAKLSKLMSSSSVHKKTPYRVFGTPVNLRLN